MSGDAKPGVPLVGAALVVFGSILPWATLGPFSVDGTAGDGKITLVVGGLGLILAIVGASKRGAMGIAAACGVACVFVSGYDLINISNKFGSSNAFSASVGIGLYMCVGGSIALTVGAAIAVKHPHAAATPMLPLPSWHPDPFGRHQLRYWDGSVWTSHVVDNGVQSSEA